MSLKRSMLASVTLKPVGMALSLLYTPILLSYLGNEQYGIWVTILSIINWINYFDVGIGNGYRNQLTKAIASENDALVFSLTRTAYYLLSMIVACVFLIGTVLICILDFNDFFKTTIDVKIVVMISFAFVSVNFIAALCKPQLFALQRTEYVSMMAVATNGLCLIFVAGLNAFFPRNMQLVAIAVGISGLLVNSVFSLISWHKKGSLRPSLGRINVECVKDICGLGMRFFLIQIAALVLYSTGNLVITICLGSSAVTAYSTTYSAFGAVASLAVAALAPMWSRITQAAALKDFAWIKRALRYSLIAILPAAICLVIFAALFRHIAAIWLGVSLDYDNGLIFCMALYYVLYLWGSVLGTTANGLERTKSQLVTGVVGALINIPLAIFFCIGCSMRTTGILVSLILILTVSNIVVMYDVVKYIKRNLDNTKPASS